MFGRPIAEPSKETDCPYDANAAEQHKRPPPVHIGQHRHYQQRCKRFRPTARSATGCLAPATRSFDGIQIVKIFVTFGKHPASPTPKKARHTIIETKFHAAPSPL